MSYSSSSTSAIAHKRAPVRLNQSRRRSNSRSGRRTTPQSLEEQEERRSRSGIPRRSLGKSFARRDDSIVDIRDPPRSRASNKGIWAGGGVSGAVASSVHVGSSKGNTTTNADTTARSGRTTTAATSRSSSSYSYTSLRRTPTTAQRSPEPPPRKSSTKQSNKSPAKTTPLKSPGKPVKTTTPASPSSKRATTKKLSPNKQRESMLESIRRVAERRKQGSIGYAGLKGDVVLPSVTEASVIVTRRASTKGGASGVGSPAKEVAAQLAATNKARTQKANATNKKTSNKGNKSPAALASKSPATQKAATTKKQSTKKPEMVARRGKSPSGSPSPKKPTAKKDATAKKVTKKTSNKASRKSSAKGVSATAIADLSDAAQRELSTAARASQKGTQKAGTQKAATNKNAKTQKKTSNKASQRGSQRKQKSPESVKTGSLLSSLAGSLKGIARSIRGPATAKNNSQRGNKEATSKAQTSAGGTTSSGGSVHTVPALETFREGGRQWRISLAAGNDKLNVSTAEQKRRQRLVWRRLRDNRRDMVEEISQVDPPAAQLLAELRGDESLDLRDEIFSEGTSSSSSSSARRRAARRNIRIDDVRVGPLVGSGSFGVVVSGLWRGKAVAVKIRKGQARMEDAIKFDSVFADETHILSLVNDSDRVVRLYGTTTVGGKPGLVMKLYPVTLGDLISDRSRRSGAGGIAINPVTMHSYLCDIAEGLRDLHDRRIVFRDLKPDNCLIDPSNRLVLADFGISQEERNEPPDEVGGTAHFMAPENFERDKPLNPKSDIWSFGCCLIHVWTGKPPWADREVADIVDTLSHTRARPVIPRAIPNIYRKMLRKCFKFKPKKRPSAQELLNMLRQYRVDPCMDSDSAGTCSAGKSTSVGSGGRRRKKGRKRTPPTTTTATTRASSSSYTYYSYS